MNEPMKKELSAKESVPVFGVPVSRVDRYGWTVADAPGKYVQYHKQDLIVDKSYQRDLRQNKVLLIAREWSWIACGALIVIEHPEIQNKYLVIDGQHRKAAADLRHDITRLPCLVFEIGSKKDEADGFLKINTMRTGLTKFEKVNAQIIRGDESILSIKAMVEKTGHTLSKGDGPKDVRCIAAIERAWNIDSELTERLWPIVVYVCDDKQVTKTIWDGFFYIYQRHDIEPHAAKLKKLGKEKIIQEIAKATAFLGVGSIKAYAHGVLKLINYGRQEKNKISID